MEEQVLVVDRKALEDRLGGGIFVTEGIEGHPPLHRGGPLFPPPVPGGV